MSYLVLFMVVCVVLGQLTVASSPSPYFGVVGLVLSAVFGSGVMVFLGNSFVSLVLFLIYLGGMLVVFAYSMALSTDPYPETVGTGGAGLYFGFFGVLVFVLGVVFVSGFNFYGLGLLAVDVSGELLTRMDICGISMFFSLGGWCLMVSAGGLLLTLFVVLELTRGLTRGSLRAV